MDILAKKLDAKIMSLKPEPLVISDRQDQVQSIDFSGLVGLGPPADSDDDFSSWLASAEKRLAKPSPAYSVPAVSERLKELEVIHLLIGSVSDPFSCELDTLLHNATGLTLSWAKLAALLCFKNVQPTSTKI